MLVSGQELSGQESSGSLAVSPALWAVALAGLCPFNDTKWQLTVLDWRPRFRTVSSVNENHQQLCPSPEWAAYIQDEVLPWLVEQVDLGHEMLEIGPGPGAATDWLRQRVKRLVAFEIDGEAARRLSKKFSGSNVEVTVGNGADLPYEADSFDSVGTFTMLHHVPTLALQRSILAEALRVLRPGGVLIGSDSLASTGLHEFHADDTYNPVDPASLLVLFQALGFERITLRLDGIVSFVAYKPDGIERCP
jgi:SAM-dependent methyltransferase